MLVIWGSWDCLRVTKPSLLLQLKSTWAPSWSPHCAKCHCASSGSNPGKRSHHTGGNNIFREKGAVAVQWGCCCASQPSCWPDFVQILSLLNICHLLQSAMQESAIEVCILLHYRFCRYAVLHAGAAEAQVCKHCLQVHSQCSTLHCVYTVHFVQCKLHTSCTNSMHNQCTGRAGTSCARIMFAKCKLLLNLRCFGQSYLLCRTCQDSLWKQCLQLATDRVEFKLAAAFWWPEGFLSPSHHDHCHHRRSFGKQETMFFVANQMSLNFSPLTKDLFGSLLVPGFG